MQDGLEVAQGFAPGEDCVSSPVEYAASTAMCDLQQNWLLKECIRAHPPGSLPASRKRTFPWLSTRLIAPRASQQLPRISKEMYLIHARYPPYLFARDPTQPFKQLQPPTTRFSGVLSAWSKISDNLYFYFQQDSRHFNIFYTFSGARAKQSWPKHMRLHPKLCTNMCFFKNTC